MGLDEETISNAAKELADPRAAQDYLDATSAGNPELRCRVEHLLGLAGPAADFFQVG
jgi:hypothetical protein